MYTRGENQMFNKKLIVLLAAVALFALVPFASAQEPTEEPAAVVATEAAPEVVEVEEGETATVPATTEIVVTDDGFGLEDLANNPDVVLLILFAAVGLIRVIDSVAGKYWNKELKPVQGVILAGRDALGDYGSQLVRQTPTVIDDRLFEVWAEHYGYVKKDSAQG
jgi:ABC-type Fe3+-hydroxamate transport system substrate-binding protein